jgi:hypothetical protein
MRYPKLESQGIKTKQRKQRQKQRTTYRNWKKTHRKLKVKEQLGAWTRCTGRVHVILFIWLKMHKNLSLCIYLKKKIREMTPSNKNKIGRTTFFWGATPMIHAWLVYSLVSCLFIKQDQMILTCNSAVASLMLSLFLWYLSLGLSKY